MSAYVYLAIFIFVFVILQTYWKTKGVLVFLLICAGNALYSSASGTVATAINNIIPSQSLPITQIIKGILLLGPGLMGMLITKKSAKKKHALVHFLANVCTAILGYLWFIRTLPYEQFSTLESTEITKQLLMLRDPLLGIGTILSMVFILIDKKKNNKHDKSKKD